MSTRGKIHLEGTGPMPLGQTPPLVDIDVYSHFGSETKIKQTQNNVPSSHFNNVIQKQWTFRLQHFHRFGNSPSILSNKTNTTILILHKPS
jgi:hypothetical protein